MNKHLTYYTLLESFTAAQYCPFCYLEEQTIKAYFGTILYESVNDSKVREELIKSEGYCCRHAHYLTNIGESCGIALLYQDQVQRFLQLLQQKSTPDWHKRIKLKDMHSLCPACQNQFEHRDKYISVFLEGILEVTELKEAYENSVGICRPHLFILLNATQNPAIQKMVYEHEKQELIHLLNELKEFIRKHDYRFNDEPFGSERDSWKRAIQKMNGSEIVF